MGCRVGELVKSPNSKSCHQHTAIGDFVELDPHDRSEYSKVTGILCCTTLANDRCTWGKIERSISESGITTTSSGSSLR